MQINGKTITINPDVAKEETIKEAIKKFNLDLDDSLLSAAIKWFCKSTYYKKYVENDTKVVIALMIYIGMDRNGVSIDLGIGSYVEVLYALAMWRCFDEKVLVEIKNLLLNTKLLAADYNGQLYIHDVSNLRRIFVSAVERKDAIDIFEEDGDLGNLKTFLEIVLAIYTNVKGEKEQDTIIRLESFIRSL